MTKRFKIKKILIPVIILGFFLAPISPVLKNNNGNLAVGVGVNKVEAVDFDPNVFTGSTLSDKSIGGDKASFVINIITQDEKEWLSTSLMDCTTVAPLSPLECSSTTFGVNPGSIGVVIFKDNILVSGIDLTTDIIKNSDTNITTNFWDLGTVFYLPNALVVEFVALRTISIQKTIAGLTPETSYTAKLYFASNDAGIGGTNAESFTLPTGTLTAKKYYQFGNPVSFKTNKAGVVTGDTSVQETVVTKPLNLGCTDLTNFSVSGCIASLFYTIWEASALIMTLAGRFLDFFLYYATNSSAYTSVFVEKGWGLIRDIANIFFIIALLYVAIKTILSLNVTNNKKLIGTIVLIALLINFSLFVTQVIIDSSNILAKVFYNQITTVKEGTTTPAETKEGGEKSVSVNLVSGFDPQRIVTTTDQYEDFGHGTFIFITLIMIFLTLYAAYMFFVVAILFIGRVVALWLCMIFSPLAFISYTLPFEIPFHHKKWWKDLLEAAFMAPIFIFFLYIIILFIEFAKDATIQAYSNTADASSQAIMLRIMGVIIPFAIIFLLLTRAKKLAVDYSGELGAMISKAGGAVMGTVGGGVVGFAAGALAKGGQATIGKYYQRVANNDELRAKAAAGDKGAQRRLARANYMAKSSFDVRQTGAGKFVGKKTGLDFNAGTGAIGLSTEKLKGGEKAHFERRVEKEEAKVKSYEMTASEAKKQDEKARVTTNQNSRASEYEKDKEKAKATLEAAGGGEYFNEAKFKEAYEKGDNQTLREQGMGKDKTVSAGSVDKVKKVETVKEINASRREAYAWSRENPNMKNETDKKGIKDFLMEWKRGMTTKGGLTTAGLAGALAPLTGGLSMLALPLGGLVHAIRATIPANKELVGRIARGKTNDQKLLEMLKTYTAEGGKKGKEKMEKTFIKEIKTEPEKGGKEEPHK